MKNCQSGFTQEDKRKPGIGWELPGLSWACGGGEGDTVHAPFSLAVAILKSFKAEQRYLHFHYLNMLVF